MIGHDILDLGNRSGGAVFMQPAGVDDVEAKVVFRRGADADLHRAFGIDIAQLDRLIHHGAVVDAGHVVIWPQIGMRVEMDHRERAEFLGIGAQDRQGDVVIATQSDAARACTQDLADMGGEGFGEI
ncbi:MAG: hypothetical protein ACD_54C01181G0003 [uncultured bacterium]|nr:MAG: hypothetical protein ACD_54C01181G0003 [uncultured bacterium]